MPEVQNYEERTVGGQTWRFADEGEGPPLVLFHGFPDSPDVWASVAGRLRALGYRTIVPYLRGYHPSTVVAKRPYDASTIANDGLGLLDALGLPSAMVIGHDWGAGVGYGMVAEAPHRVDGLVTIAIPHPTALKPSLSAAWALRHFVHFKLPLAEQRTRRGDFAYMRRMSRRLRPDDSPQEVDETMISIREMLSDPAVLKGMIDYYRAASPTIDASYRNPHRVPHLFVAGEDEVEIVGGVEAYQRSAGAFEPEGTLLLVPASLHTPHLDNEELFVDTVHRFLLGVPGYCSA